MTDQQSYKPRPGRQTQWPDRKPPRGQKWWWVLAVCIVVLAGGLYYLQDQFQPPKAASDQAVEVDIQSGASSSAIGDQLVQKGMIKNKTVFKYYLAFEGYSSKLKAGKYYLKPGMTMDEIAAALVNGDPQYATVKFTIPEGYTIEQIADLLSQEQIVDKQAFLNEADNGVFNYDFLKNIPSNPDVKHRLEGYLFPDTYEVYKNTDAHHVIDLMLQQMDTVLTPEWQAQMKKDNLTVQQTLTIASIIEREAKVDKERPIISGVIENRLHANPPMDLQIDATVQYALGKTKPVLSYNDLKVDSPYNTYLHQGLPPGPIACPGAASIQAALYPDKNDYLYYVAKNDGSGEHYFAKTYTEHLQNIAKSNQNLKNQQEAK